eukprot:scaffold295170_cov44-Prasinocladus_malaysianus.AAC.1
MLPFTSICLRVVIGDLKEDICQLLMDDEQSLRMCNELAHVYHYYLHGAGGNRADPKAPRQVETLLST